MIEIDLKVDKAFTELVRSVLDDVAVDPSRKLVECASVVTNDADLLDYWRGEMVGGLREDLGVLRNFLGTADFGRNTFSIEDEMAFCLIRACSALRNHLRESALDLVSDGDLESGNVESVELDEPGQLSWAAYSFLAALQEYIVRQLG